MGISFWGEDLDELIIRNVKLITEAADGIDPVSCRDCLIENNFVFSSDDAICVKERYRATQNVKVIGNIVWSTHANGLKIGGKLAKLGPIKGIEFIDNDVLFNGPKYGKGFILATRAPWEENDVTATMKNTYVENSIYLLDTYSNYYNPDTDKGYKWKGKIRLTIDNMRLHKAWPGEDGIHIDAEKDPKKVDAIVTFNNLWVQDRYIASIQDLKDLGYKPAISPNVKIIFNVDTEAPAAPINLKAVVKK